jgi:hypothetical protein
MTWTTHYFDRRLNNNAVSRAFTSKEGALREACYLMRQNCVVLSSKARMTKKSTLLRSLHGARSIRYAEIQHLLSRATGD